MKYIAHIDGNREQLLKDHLQGTARLAEKFAEKFGNADWGFFCGMLHDIGKYSDEFQKKIQGDINLKVDHSTAGAQVCKQLEGYYQFVSYCIAGHHSGLPDYGRKGATSTLCDRLEKKVCDYSRYKMEISIPSIQSDPFDINNAINPDYSMSVFIRMLYSCLVDADFLDTEGFMRQNQNERDPGQKMEILLERGKKYVAKWLDNMQYDSINGRRTEILKSCMVKGKSPKGLFQLTVPTGGGKTVASMMFALQHAVSNKMDRIIYVIPYTSIIEQNAQVFREILGNENVLENHSNVEYDGTEEFKALQLAAENWDKPVIVTTNVQFFESFYANKSSKCRKLHNIANSVIIFDEAQMLPTNYLKPCIAAMDELLQKYGVSIVLCTATQPALSTFFSKKYAPTELCPRRDAQFSFFERVTYQTLGSVTEEDMINRLQEEKQALCIVNTRKIAQRLYGRIQGEGVFHLSTSMYPAHRRRTLQKIRERIAEKKRCIVISTSLVEAGVDLDFMSVYRELAGVDSIIQAAGRCNRNGTRDKKNSFVYIFEWEKKERVPGQRQQIDIAKCMLAEGKDITTLESIKEYFQRLYHIKGESLDVKKILQQFEGHEYNFCTAARDFHLIEESTIMIFVGKEPAAQQLLQEIQQRGLTKGLMRKAGQYCVNIYKRDGGQNQLFDEMYKSGMVELVVDGAKDFYKLVDEQQYQDDTGLKLEVEVGKMILY